jgi:hypothetical protein
MPAPASLLSSWLSPTRQAWIVFANMPIFALTVIPSALEKDRWVPLRLERRRKGPLLAPADAHGASIDTRLYDGLWLPTGRKQRPMVLLAHRRLRPRLPGRLTKPRQGRFQGVLASAASLASNVAPLAFSTFYFVVQKEWPGGI